MKNFLKSRWPLLLLLVIFIAFKIPHLFYPYYWDESSPYAPAIRAMYDHGISLVPGAIDTTLSRGHPTFFHALAACWMMLFGTTPLVMHCFALLISLILLVTIYEVGYRIFNKRVAVLATVLIAVQEVFFVQSSFVLPEVMLALTAFASMYFYVRERYILTTMLLTALFFTKESGLIMGFVLGVDACGSFFFKPRSLKQSLYKLLAVGIPCLLIGAFFIIQKQTLGWYLFPEHTGMLRTNWEHFWYHLRRAVASDAFYGNYKYYYFLFLVPIAAIAAYKKRNIRLAAYLIPVIPVFYTVNKHNESAIVRSVFFFVLVFATWTSATYYICHPSVFPNSKQRRFFAFSALFVLCFTIFSAINFYTFRYFIVALVPLLFIVSVLLELYLSSIHKALLPLAFGLIAVVTYFAYTFDPERHGDIDLGAFDAMKVHEGIVDYLEQKQYYDKQIGTGSPLEEVHLKQPHSGFLKKDKPFEHIAWEITDETDFVIFDNIENDDRYPSIKTDSGFKLEYRVEYGHVWGEIYKRN